MEELFVELRALAERLELAYLGVADLQPPAVHEAVLAQGGPVVAGFPRCVSLGIALPNAVVNGLAQPNRWGNAENYRIHGYDVINERLSAAASMVGSVLVRHGYDALPMSLPVKAEDKPLTSVFSHKLGARHAGFGWIGKSCLLVTPERGPRVRWASVLTDAPLSPTGGPLEQRCGTCMECVNICPAGAYTGRNYADGEPREARFDARKCSDYLDSLEAVGRPRVCGLCLYACPWGRH